MTRISSAAAAAALVCVLAEAAAAQTYRDLTLVRNRPPRFAKVVQLRGGLALGIADDEIPAAGIEDVEAFNGSAYWRQEDVGEQAVVEAYAGTDGAYLGLKDDDFAGQQAQNRLELTSRYFSFFREGFYRGDDYVPTGRYEGDEYAGYVATSRLLDQGLRLEGGAFYRRYVFDANETTSPTFIVPDDFNGYGARLVLEHKTLTLDRVHGRPDAGYILTLAVEREQNDSNRRFGTIGVFESTLPSGVWRGQGHLEWLFPHTTASTFVVVVDGQWSDEKDRIYNFDAAKTIGHLWGDGQVRWRLLFGDALEVTPYVMGRYQKVVSETGVGSSAKTFFGAGLDLHFEFSDNLALVAQYSFLNNENREVISPTKDTMNEHHAFFGLEVRFGTERKF